MIFTVFAVLSIQTDSLMICKSGSWLLVEPLLSYLLINCFNTCKPVLISRLFGPLTLLKNLSYWSWVPWSGSTYIKQVNYKEERWEDSSFLCIYIWFNGLTVRDVHHSAWIPFRAHFKCQVHNIWVQSLLASHLLFCLQACAATDALLEDSVSKSNK